MREREKACTDRGDGAGYVGLGMGIPPRPTLPYPILLSPRTEFGLDLLPAYPGPLLELDEQVIRREDGRQAGKVLADVGGRLAFLWRAKRQERQPVGDRLVVRIGVAQDGIRFIAAIDRVREFNQRGIGPFARDRDLLGAGQVRVERREP